MWMIQLIASVSVSAWWWSCFVVFPLSFQNWAGWAVVCRNNCTCI